jgi:hypothetical protein
VGRGLLGVSGGVRLWVIVGGRPYQIRAQIQAYNDHGFAGKSQVTSMATQEIHKGRDVRVGGSAQVWLPPPMDAQVGEGDPRARGDGPRTGPAGKR